MDDEYCPTCGSNDISAEFDSDKDGLIFTYYCESCGRSWGEVEEAYYELD